jgi:1-acyl-sn-glycerol-3-phosphate acyltransferase
MRLVYKLGYNFFGAIARGFFNYQVYGREHQLKGGALIASNHVSFMDPPSVGLAFDHEIFYMARKTLLKNAFVAWFYRAWNTIPIDQERPEMGPLKKVIKLLRGGDQVIIFPEGERSRDGQLLPAQAGVGLIIAKSKVPVMPVRIFGAHEAMPRGKTFPQPADLKIVFGPPIYFTEEELSASDREGYQALGDRVMEAIAKIQEPLD